jgi:hypothetical protein
MSLLGKSNLQDSSDNRFGSQPWASEYNAAGDLLWAARYPENVQAYRMVRANWTGIPRTGPSIYISTSADNNTAHTYISWNGDSRVTQWRVYASQNETGDGMTFDKMGFETMYEFQLDWPQGVEEMSIWAEGLNGDQVVGTTQRVMVTREGQGGKIEDQSGVGAGVSNTTSSVGGDAGNSTSADSQGNGASAFHSTSIMMLFVAGAVSLLV